MELFQGLRLFTLYIQRYPIVLVEDDMLKACDVGVYRRNVVDIFQSAHNGQDIKARSPCDSFVQIWSRDSGSRRTERAYYPATLNTK